MAARTSLGFRRLSVITAVATYLLIVWGGVVRVTGSGLGCGSTDDWPLCRGGLLPPFDGAALVEFTHRWLAATATALVIVVAVWVYQAYRGDPQLRRAMIAVVLLFTLQIVLGAVTVKLKLPGYVVMVHLANALLLLGGLVFVALVANSPPPPVHPTRATRSPGAGIAIGAAAATFALVLSGALVVSRGAGSACSGWPLCGGGFTFSGQGLAAVNLLHRLVAGGVVLFLGFAMARVRSRHGGDRALRMATTMVNVLLLLQVVAGAVVAGYGLPAAARGLHLALASALWAVVVLVALLLRIGPLVPSAMVEREQVAEPASAGLATS